AILGALVPITFVALLLVERIFPARELPKVRFWLLKGIVFFVLGGIINAVVPALLARAVRPHTPLDLSVLGDLGGGILAFLASDFVAYCMHRTLHNVPWLWRWTHQMHHSAERVDVAGGSYFHPFDFLLEIGMVTVVVLALGVTPNAAALAGYIGFCAGMFQ